MAAGGDQWRVRLQHAGQAGAPGVGGPPDHHHTVADMKPRRTMNSASTAVGAESVAEGAPFSRAARQPAASAPVSTATIGLTAMTVAAPPAEAAAPGPATGGTFAQEATASIATQETSRAAITEGRIKNSLVGTAESTNSGEQRRSYQILSSPEIDNIAIDSFTNCSGLSVLFRLD
jgi:hypothetical protein